MAAVCRTAIRKSCGGAIPSVGTRYMFGLPKIRFVKKNWNSGIKIYLPWKILGPDGDFHQATLEITYDHTQTEETFALAKKFDEERRQNKQKELAKKIRSGLRRCPGHRGTVSPPRVSQCTICGGWVY